MEANQSDDRKLCTDCHTFWGTQATNFLCSTCFKKQGGELPKPPVQVQIPKQATTEKIGEEVKIEPGASGSAAACVAAPEKNEQAKAPEAPKVQTDTNKCWDCKKKVGLVKVPCKCGYVYCPKHRHAEAHDCSYDYVKAHQQKLVKENPQIQHQKMEKMF